MPLPYLPLVQQIHHQRLLDPIHLLLNLTLMCRPIVKLNCESENCRGTNLICINFDQITTVAEKKLSYHQHSW